MMKFFDDEFADSRPLYEKSTVLESVCHYGTFRVCDSESFDVVKKKIAVYMSSQEKRFEGLVLLKTVSDQCSTEVFQQNALSWAQMVLKVLQHHGESSGSRKMAYRILKDSIGCMLSSPHLKREASISFLPGLIDTLLESSIDDEWIDHNAECLSACIKYFPAACGLKKDKIEEFLILLLDRWELKEFEPIAECFAYLPACGVDGNDKTSSFQKMWAEQFKQFISVLNAVLNILYDGVENGCGDLKICSTKPLPPVPEDKFSAVLKLVHRFKAFGLCISKMLVSASCFRVVVPADILLLLLSRTLSVSPSEMERELMIYPVLPQLYLAALTVLESFILSCDQHLMSVCQLVSKFLTQAIKNNSLKTSSSKDSLNLVRCAAYQVLQLYTERYKLFSVAENHREFLVSVMIHDMKPSVTEVKLDKPSKSVLHSRAVETTESGKHPSCSRTSTEALKALKDFAVYGNLDLKNFEEIYTSVVNTLIEIQEKPLDLPVPYCEETYRLALYSLLHTLSININSQNFSCLPATISLVTNGLEDLSPMVRSKCQEILDATDVLVNTIKERMPESPSVKETCEGEMVLNGEQTFSQMGSSAGIFPVAHRVVSNEHSTTNETPSSITMVNGVLSIAVVEETPPSQTVESNRSLHSELSEEPERQRQDSGGEITVQAEDDGEPVFYTNSNAYPSSEPEIEEEEEEEEEMDVEEEEEEEEEEFKNSYVNHNGFSSEDECISEEEEEEEELSQSKRPSSSADVQSNGPSPKKVNLNDAEDHSDPDVSLMLQDFIPTSPDHS